MNEKKTEIEDLLEILSQSGLSVSSLEELAIPGRDWSLIKKILGKFFSYCQDSELKKTILRIMNLIAMQEGGASYADATKIIADQEKDNRQVCVALSSIGIQISNIYDLVNSENWYHQAVPVLVEFLPTLQSSRIKEGIVRALSIKGLGVEVCKLLIKEYKSTDSLPANASLKWALANAISITIEDELADDLVELIRDKKHGKSRGILLTAFEKIKLAKYTDVILESLEDNDLVGYSIETLGKLRVHEALPHLEKYLTHADGRIRKEAQKAINKISKR